MERNIHKNLFSSLTSRVAVMAFSASMLLTSCVIQTGGYTETDGVYYDPNILYNAEIKMLRKYCRTCLDDGQMQLLMLIVFKRQLLEQAIATAHNKEALQFYLDLCKLLNVNINTKTVNTGCRTCVNGVCKL